MICKRLSDNKYFNYKFTGKNNDFIQLSNPYPPEEFNIIRYETWLNEYMIIDKWRTLSYN